MACGRRLRSRDRSGGRLKAMKASMMAARARLFFFIIFVFVFFRLVSLRTPHQLVA